MSMTEEKKVVASAAAPFWTEMFQAGLYKRTQGRITRQVTFAALAIAFAVGWWRLAVTMAGWEWFRGMVRGIVPRDLDFVVVGMLVAGVLFLLPGIWFAYRIVNYSRFADFLIAVEAEMNKVSWPTRPELIRAVAVVLFTVAFLSVVLFGYDLVWNFIFQRLGVRGGVMGGG
jgi:preprotein translocase subunit SecE